MLIALAVFSIYWIISARRWGRHSWPETIVALLVQIALLALVAWLLPDWVWKTVLLLYLALPWCLGPWLAWAQRRPTGLDAQPYDPEQHAVPPELRAAVEARAEALEAAGLARLGTFFSSQDKLVNLQVPLESADGHEWAVVSGAEYLSGKGTDAEVRTRVVECGVAYRMGDGRRLVVRDSDQDPVPRIPGMVRERMPSLVEPARLLAFARAYRALACPDVPTVPVREGLSPLEFLHVSSRRGFDAQARSGRLRALPEGGYLLTAWGVLRMTLEMLPFVRQAAGVRVRLRERTLLRKVGMAAPPAAGRWWLNELDVRGAALVAVILAMLFPLPPLSLATPLVADLEPAALVEQKPYVLPAGFSVPADFPGAVRALERLAGMAAVPLEVEDVYTLETVRTEGVEVRFAADRTDAFLRAAAPLFRARGFLLFRHENTFGHGGQPEFIGLFPRADEAEVLRLVGTNGTNYGIDPDSVVAWLTRLRARHPFVIFGIAHDAVEGRFLTPPDEAQARALAEEFHAFCPDVVTQGTETVRALAAEFRKGTLYCWWD